MNNQQFMPQSNINNVFVSGPENLHTLLTGPVYGANYQLSHYRAVLSWIPATSNEPISRYEIYRGETRNDMRKIGETSMGHYTDPTVQPGRLYYYFVVAFNPMNIPSPVSNTHTVTVQY